MSADLTVIPADLPFVSVIVPVHGAAAHLPACLERLAAQTYPPDRYEVIVVDNGCPTLAATLAPHAADPRFRVAHEPRPGSYAARNAGLAVARGAVLAFTDDDCAPNADWLERGVASVATDARPTLVAGCIALVVPRPTYAAPLAYDYSATYSFRGVKRPGVYGATANLFVPRAVFDAIGPFDPRLLSGGDMELGRRAEAHGFASRYERDARVTHAARGTVGAILRRELRLAGGNQVNRENTRPTGGPRAMLREIYHIELRWHLPWALRALREPSTTPARRRVAVGALMVVAQSLRALERVRIYLGGAPRRS